MGFTLSPRARADLDGIWDYTAERWNADQADRYIRQLAEAFGNIADGSTWAAPRMTSERATLRYRSVRTSSSIATPR